MQQLVPVLIAGDPLPLPVTTSPGNADPVEVAAAVGIYTFADGSRSLIVWSPSYTPSSNALITLTWWTA